MVYGGKNLSDGLSSTDEYTVNKRSKKAKWKRDSKKFRKASRRRNRDSDDEYEEGERKVPQGVSVFDLIMPWKETLPESASTAD